MLGYVCHYIVSGRGSETDFTPTVAWAEVIQAAIYGFKEITSPYWLNVKRLRDQKIAMIGDKISAAARSKTGK